MFVSWGFWSHLGRWREQEDEDCCYRHPKWWQRSPHLCRESRRLAIPITQLQMTLNTQVQNKVWLLAKSLKCIHFIFISFSFYYYFLKWCHFITHQISTFSETGSFLITSGAIQATVPANDIFVLLSLSSLDVPKSEIFTVSLWVTKTLEQRQREDALTCYEGQTDLRRQIPYHTITTTINCIQILDSF